MMIDTLQMTDSVALPRRLAAVHRPAAQRGAEMVTVHV
jgi:hypothetical protein